MERLRPEGEKLPELNQRLLVIQPTLDAVGSLAMLSRTDPTKIWRWESGSKWADGGSIDAVSSADMPAVLPLVRREREVLAQEIPRWRKIVADENMIFKRGTDLGGQRIDREGLRPMMEKNAAHLASLERNLPLLDQWLQRRVGKNSKVD